LVSFRLMPLVWHRSGGNGAIGGHCHDWHAGSRTGYKELPHGLYHSSVQDLALLFMSFS
jgi:hypothetical protein